MAQADPDHALPDLDRAIKLDAKNAGGYAVSALSMKALILSGRSNLDGALASVEQAVRFDPLRPSLYVQRGSIRSRKDDLDGAMADFDRAIQLDTGSAGGFAVAAMTEKARLHLDKGDFDRAIEDYNAAIQRNPKLVALYLDRAAIWTRRGDAEHALADYGDAIQANPKSGLAYNSRGDFFRNKGDYDKAIADYDHAAENQPDDITAYGNRGLARFYAGAYAKAADDFRRVVAAQPNLYSALWLYLAAAQSNRKEARDELAKTDAQLKISDWPHPIVELFLGKKSASEAEAAAGNDDQRCEAKFYVGEWQLMSKNRKDAAKALQAAVENCPKGLAEYQGAVTQMKLLN